MTNSDLRAVCEQILVLDGQAEAEFQSKLQFPPGEHPRIEPGGWEELDEAFASLAEDVAPMLARFVLAALDECIKYEKTGENLAVRGTAMGIHRVALNAARTHWWANKT